MVFQSSTYTHLHTHTNYVYATKAKWLSMLFICACVCVCVCVPHIRAIQHKSKASVDHIPPAESTHSHACQFCQHDHCQSLALVGHTVLWCQFEAVIREKLCILMFELAEKLPLHQTSVSSQIPPPD